jgi:hypothetical protein
MAVATSASAAELRVPQTKEDRLFRVVETKHDLHTQLPNRVDRGDEETL